MLFAYQRQKKLMEYIFSLHIREDSSQRTQKPLYDAVLISYSDVGAGKSAAWARLIVPGVGTIAGPVVVVPALVF